MGEPNTNGSGRGIEHSWHVDKPTPEELAAVDKALVDPDPPVMTPEAEERAWRRIQERINQEKPRE